MSTGLPAVIDPIRLAEEGVRLKGELLLSAMPRLLEGCNGGNVTIDLQFDCDADGLRRMRGTIGARIEVVCQRCLQKMLLDLEVSPQMVLLRPEEKNRFLDQREEAIVIEEPLTLSGLVEDELLLAMPMIPMHELEACPAAGYVGKGKEDPKVDKNSPFAVLEKLKHDSIKR